MLMLKPEDCQDNGAQFRSSVSERVQGYRFGDDMKRVVDLLIACTLIALFLPLTTIVAFAIKLDSRGPVLSPQTRLTFGGRRVSILQFRTTAHEAQNKNGGRNPGRHVTRVGRLLRWSRIDALPQLINVLNGELTLIGAGRNRPDFFGPQ
jgi:lipopolysaccharide/colanic/teichoic acid biosynthesis glycosyltransferase